MRRRSKIASGILLLISIITILFASTIHDLVVLPTTISFPDQDPDSYPEVTALNDLVVTFRVTSLFPSEYWVMELFAQSDLTSGSNTIPIENVRWTISGTAVPPASFQNGTLSRGVYVEAGRGPGDSKNKQAIVVGALRFYLQNSWSYEPGNYSAPVTLRVTAPGTVDSRTITLTLNIASRISLQFDMNTINFPGADPDDYPSIPASENPVTVTSNVRTSPSTPSYLTCLATNDLISGSSIIDISNVSWQASGAGYVSGTMSKTIAQTAGTWTGSGTRVGTFSYYLVNSWSYATGQYTITVTYTLTAL